jgi:PAS domain S-box-containing protein
MFRLIQSGRLSKELLLALTALAIPSMGMIDWLTRTEIAYSIFYLIPVMLAAWFLGHWPGTLLALASGTTWLAAELASGLAYSHPWVPYWNGFVRAIILVLSALLTAETAYRKRLTQTLLRERNAALEAEVAVRAEAERKLTALNETLEERVRERSAAAEERSRLLARSEAALKSQTDILQSILNSMGDGVIVADTRGQVMVFNPEAERILQTALAGATIESCIRQHQTYLPDMLTSYPTHQHPLERALHGEAVDGAEMFLRREESDEGLWLNATGRPLTDADGQVRGGVIVFSDITSRKLLEKQIAEISEREQRRIGQDLHDGLCQQLVSAALTCTVLYEQLAGRQSPEVREVKDLARLLNDSITQARALARGFYPVRLQVEGLASALEELAEGVQSRTGVPCQFTCESPVIIHDQVAGVNLYRIAQEAVNNALKHSRARRIVIDLNAVEEEVTLTVADDGVGFTPARNGGGGMGLHIMSYRARMIGASFDVRRRLNGGTIVSCFYRNVEPNQHAYSRTRIPVEAGAA